MIGIVILTWLGILPPPISLRSSRLRGSLLHGGSLGLLLLPGEEGDHEVFPGALSWGHGGGEERANEQKVFIKKENNEEVDVMPGCGRDRWCCGNGLGWASERDQNNG